MHLFIYWLREEAADCKLVGVGQDQNFLSDGSSRF